MGWWVHCMHRCGNVSKKNEVDTIVNHWLHLLWKIRAMPVLRRKDFVTCICTNGREFWSRFSVPKSLIIKRHLAVDTLGLPFFTHCTKANITDDQGLIELLSHNLDYFPPSQPTFQRSPFCKGHGYHPDTLEKALQALYPQVMTKIRFQLAPKPTKAEKAA